jgi:creatinine amidohydrolase
MDTSRLQLKNLTRDEFHQAVQDGRWLLVPLGSVEQHGPHLPLGTDLLYAEHVCEQVARLMTGIIAPGLPYGVCRTMRNFPGTVSLSPATFAAMVHEILAEYIRHGARRLALIGGHAEPAQDAAVREAALPLVNADPTLTILYIGPYDFLDPIRRAADLLGTDGHAGSIETSQMLVIAPDRVHTDRIPAVTRPPLSRFRVLANPESEFPTGVRGDTAKVSRSLGERALDHVVSEIVHLLRNLQEKGTER